MQQSYTAVAAEPTWLSATDLSVVSEVTVQGAGNPEIAVNDRGDAVAVWWRNDGTNWRVQAATRSAESYYWSMPANLSQGESGTNESAPQVVLDDAGNAVAVWVSWAAPGSAKAIEAAVRPAGRPWSQATPLATVQAPQSVGFPQLAIDGAGEAVAVWELDDNSNSSSIVQVTTRGPDGEWGALSNLQAPEQNVGNSRPQVAIDRDGNTLAVWAHVDEELRWSIQEAVRPAGSHWSQPVNLYTANEGQFAQNPQVAVSDGGDAAAVWELYDDSNSSSIVQAAFRSAGSDWSEPTPISDAAQSATEPQVAVSDNSDAVAVWESEDATVQSADRLAGGDWSEPVPVSQVTGKQVSSAPHAAIDDVGDAVAVWELWDSSNQVVQAAEKPAGGKWSEPTDVSSRGQERFEPRVASDDAGNAAATWTSKACGNDGNCSFTIQGAGLDAAGPILDALSVPQSGSVGIPVELSALPFDVWSGVAETSWDFGDGQAATGETVRHAYADPGDYQVRVSAADLLGNTSTESFTLAIQGQPSSSGPAPPPPAAPATGPAASPLATANIAALSGVSMKIRCAKGGSKRLVGCSRNGRRAQKLVVRFAASAGARVLIEVTGRSARRPSRGRAPARPRTLLSRIVSARQGTNRFVLPFKASGKGGQLTGSASVVVSAGPRTAVGANVPGSVTTGVNVHLKG